jgi:hypothetical protein
MKNNFQLNDFISFKESNKSLRYGQITSFPDTITDNNWIITWQDGEKEKVCDMIFHAWLRDGRIKAVDFMPNITLNDEEEIKLFSLDEPNYNDDIIYDPDDSIDSVNYFDFILD